MAQGVNPETGANAAQPARPEAAGKSAQPARPESLNPLTLAYIGDAVYELYVREHIICEGEMSPGKMNRAAVGQVRAEAQSALVRRLEPLFTEEEADIYRRGKNAKSHTHAKHASLADYHRATGLEAVLGYLYLMGNQERLHQLLTEGAKKDETP